MYGASDAQAENDSTGLQDPWQRKRLGEKKKGEEDDDTPVFNVIRVSTNPIRSKPLLGLAPFTALGTAIHRAALINNL